MSWSDKMGPLEIVILLLVLVWLLGGFVVPFGGANIHLLLIVIVVLVVARWVARPPGD